MGSAAVAARDKRIMSDTIDPNEVLQTQDGSSKEGSSDRGEEAGLKISASSGEKTQAGPQQ